jgi:two-component system, cell cycle sensor histidine kinase and response regulator CckA
MPRVPRLTYEQAKKLQALAQTLEWSHDAIVGSTVEGIITSWNRGARTIYGYHDEEIIGQPVTVLVPRDRAGEIDSIFQELRRGRTVENYETVRVTKSGQQIDLSITASPVRDAKGNIVGVTAICRDVTAQKRAEIALQESERHYRLLFESNPLPMWVFDRATLRFLAVNEAAVRQYGYSRSEFLRMTIRDIRPKKDLPDFLTAISHSTRGLVNFGIWRHQRKDGNIRYVEITSHDLPFYGADAELVMAKDVSDRVHSDAQLRQSEERFSKAFRSSPVAISISTEDGTYIDVNQAFLRMLNREREEVVGQTVRELRVWREHDHRTAMVEELKRAGRVDRLRAQFCNKAGESRRVLVSAEIIELDDRPCILAIAEDVTETEQLEQQFRQAQRMEAIGRLAGGVAHDFNNVLGVILGYSELLQQRLSSDEIAVSQLEEIKNASERAAALTRHLLAFSRQQLLQPRLLNLNEVLATVSSMLYRIIGEDIDLALVPAADLGTVSADPTQVEQIIMNLVVNARDAMPNGGRLTIRTENVRLDQDYVNVHPGSRVGLFVLLSVTDTGTGIPSDILPHIFEPFFTTKKAGQGTGLGLSTVYGIVKQSEGCIWVDSKPDAGTTFNVYFSRVDASPATSPLEPARDVTRTGSETILVVEDDSGLRKLVLEILKSGGYHGLEASDSDAARKILAALDTPPDLLLTDVVMPKGSGHELAKEVQQSRPAVKVLYMSGHSSELVHESAKDPDRQMAIVEKPFTRNSLLAAVRAALES